MTSEPHAPRSMLHTVFVVESVVWILGLLFALSGYLTSPLDFADYPSWYLIIAIYVVLVASAVARVVRGRSVFATRAQPRVEVLFLSMRFALVLPIVAFMTIASLAGWAA